MPRRSRIHLPGMPLHIVQRGHNRDACFFGEQHYLAYQHWLHEALQENDCALHAYVLMTNHVHLLITPQSAEAVSRFVMALGRRYVQYINKTCGRTGTLWDSRYKSSLIDSEPYLLSCQRYIEMNPVRARMVDDPAHYRWSSYRGNALGQADPLLTPHAIYAALGSDEAARSKQYRALFRTQIDNDPINDIRLALQQSQPLGDSRFADTIERMTGQRREVRARGRPRKVEPEQGRAIEVR
jgi:putative transposase